MALCFPPNAIWLIRVAPTFQKAIDIILKPMVGMFVNVYMDNVIISSPSFTQHVEHLKEVFRLLHEAGLTLNKEKCKFGCDELKYFGLIINKEGVKTDETKVQAIVEMKPPGNSKEKAFDMVKAAITKAPVLKLMEFKNPFELFTDASSLGVGAVLNQEQRPVVFASRTLSVAERNYTVTERECLAVVWALNKFRTYLGSLPIKRGRHNREDQFDPEKAEEGTTTPTSKSEQDQTTGMPDEEVINNGRTRKEKKRVRECHYP
ncbi:retrovirus-related Pol polyprotein from transposon 297 [Trichonephila clavipes]|uniref:Retrovirus-related Pol polyprotein from transposon 297 n=1 Tax=Trichonephila clavipes TaxID=2585209 RepID=A0A8X6WFF4_TRICX|nr:retrovirus-related Pol polyprotein from transposon 297 [Trichonephila clavipes]